MKKFSAAVLICLFLDFVSFVASQQHSCLGSCRVVCDDEPHAGPNLFSRGKMGPKGEKGNTGRQGEKGESDRHVTTKHAAKLERLERIIEENSALIEKQSVLIKENSGLIDELSSNYHSFVVSSNLFTVCFLFAKF